MANTIPTLTKRLVKGTPLTAQEGDNNLDIITAFFNALAASLGVTLNPDGTLKDGALNAAGQILDGIITPSKFAPNAIWQAGDIRPTASTTAYSTTADAGWLECDGSLVSRTVFLNLWKTLGGGADVGTGTSPWGNGDGSTTFNLPDLRGRALIGVGTGAGLTGRNRGSTGGEETHTLLTAELAAHTHPITNVTVAGGTTTGYGAAGGRDGVGPIAPGVTTDANTGGVAHNNMQPWAAMRWLMKT